MISDEYQQSIRELARAATMPDAMAERMEAELQRAFGTAGAASERSPGVRWLVALAAAAAVIIAVSAAVWFTRQPVTPDNVTAGPNVSTTDPAGPKAGTTHAAALKAGPTDTGGATNAAIAPRLPRRASRNTLPPVIRPAGFVPVPAAAALPRFESGVIVRVALPVTALPSYGIDISPASSGQPVEADVLLGQDGLARAIRLVNTSRSQQ